MKVKIEIDCDDPSEIYAHLRVIIVQIKRQVKVLEREQGDKKWKPFTVSDDNCYGSHTARVIDDVGPLKIKS